MEIKKLIEQYKPYNEQEIKDKDIFLKYINTFDDVLTRNNEFGHFAASGWVLNSTRNKVLMIYHKIYNSWGWIGGHADGEENLYEVAVREIGEETGVTNIKPIITDIFAINNLPVKGHFKRGNYISAHCHLSVVYLFEADEKEKLIIKEDENDGVKWIPIDQVVAISTEPHMQTVYQKLIDKLKNI